LAFWLQGLGAGEVRGVVTLAGIRLGKIGEVSVDGGVDPCDLRSWALYWDKIVVPETRLIGVAKSGDFNFLVQRGLVEETFVEVGNGEFSDLLRKARRSVFEQYDKTMPGSWSLGAGPEEEGQDPEQRAIRVKLAAALPVPTEDVPLDELLEFKERNADLRQSLLQLIDETYLSIVASPDKPVAEHLALEKLMAGAREHFEQFRETSWRYRLMDIAADFNIAPAVFGAISMAGVSVSAGGTGPQVVGNSLLAGASLTVSQVGSLFKRAETKSPYRYLTALRQEVYGTDL